MQRAPKLFAIGITIATALTLAFGQAGSNSATKPVKGRAPLVKPSQASSSVVEPKHEITVLPAQPIINNIPASKEGVNWWIEGLKLIPTFLAAYFGYVVAMRSVVKKAGIDEKAAEAKQNFDKVQQDERLDFERLAERQRQLGLIHQDRADALSTIIGSAFTFAAAAERTHSALSTMESHALSNASNLDDKRQNYFVERARLAEAAALLNAEAEKYGALPSELKLKKKYLTNYVHDWSDSFNRRANDSKDNRGGFVNEAYAIVNDLRKLKEHEEAQRLALVMDSEPTKVDLKEFDWLVD